MPSTLRLPSYARILMAATVGSVVFGFTLLSSTPSFAVQQTITIEVLAVNETGFGAGGSGVMAGDLISGTFDYDENATVVPVDATQSFLTGALNSLSIQFIDLGVGLTESGGAGNILAFVDNAATTGPMGAPLTTDAVTFQLNSLVGDPITTSIFGAVPDIVFFSIQHDEPQGGSLPDMVTSLTTAPVAPFAPTVVAVRLDYLTGGRSLLVIPEPSFAGSLLAGAGFLCALLSRRRTTAG